MRTEPKIFHARINLVSDKFWKTIKVITTIFFPRSEKKIGLYTKQAENNAQKRKKVATFRLLRGKIIRKFERSGNITRQSKSVKKHRHYRQKKRHLWN